jgi:hypothetical protein
MDTIVLGEGVLGWPAEERQTDRYGLIHLNPGANTDDSFAPHVFDTAHAGAHGRLVAVVLETRPSRHVGDWARALGPTTPEVGEETTLGTGTLLIVAWRWGPSLIGVKPDQDRNHDWLDPAALYRCHHQTVRLELRPDGTAVHDPRCYGSSYPDTADLDLPQLAEKLMAELITRAADPDNGLPVHAEYSAAVNPARRTIILAVFGLTDEEIYDHPDAPAQTVITHHAQPILDAHNWTNTHDPNDYRFTATLVVFDHAGQAKLADRGRGPGTVRVITEDRDGWWNA